MTNKVKGTIIYYVGLVVSILAPFIATLTQFPVWTENVEPAKISGMFLFMAFLCVIPMFNHFKEKLKSPSSEVIWILLFIVFWAMKEIIDQMVIITLVGAIANIIGRILCVVGDKIKVKPDPVEEDEV